MTICAFDGSEGHSYTVCFSNLTHNFSLKLKHWMMHFSLTAPNLVSNLWYSCLVKWHAVTKKVVIRLVHRSHRNYYITKLTMYCRNHPSFPLLLQLHNIIPHALNVIVFHYTSWYPSGSERSEYFLDPDQSPYILATNQTAFKMNFLDHQIVHSGATFESQVLVYNASFGS